MKVADFSTHEGREQRRVPSTVWWILGGFCLDDDTEVALGALQGIQPTLPLSKVFTTLRLSLLDGNSLTSVKESSHLEERNELGRF
ncbi:hypothetical protein KCV06_g403, partial [Aureobasidium melanogenum]